MSSFYTFEQRLSTFWAIVSLRVVYINLIYTKYIVLFTFNGTPALKIGMGFGVFTLKKVGNPMWYKRLRVIQICILAYYRWDIHKITDILNAIEYKHLITDN